MLRSDQSAWYVAVARRMSAQATATERVQQDILRNLCLRTPLVLKTTCAPGSARIRVQGARAAVLVSHRARSEVGVEGRARSAPCTRQSAPMEALGAL